MKKSAKKLLALLIACVLIASLAACGNGGTTTSTPPSGDTSTAPSTAPSGDTSTAPSTAPSAAPDRTLNIVTAQDQGTLHPQNVSGAGNINTVTRTLYEPLYTLAADGSFVWLLATGLDTHADNHYTFHLREGVTFSNGNPFTAEDVMFSLKLYGDHPQHFVIAAAVDFEKTNIVDDYTIDFWLTAYSVIQFPALASMCVFDKESYDELALVDSPVGTGAYVLAEYVVNSHIDLKAREDYWGGEPAIKKIHFLVINEDSQKVNAITTGEVDYSVIPVKDAEYVESLGGYNIIKNVGDATTCTYFNVTEGTPLGTLEAREAVMHAIDRQAIVDIVYSGQTTVPRWPLSEHYLDFEERMANMSDVYSIGYDPVKAKELAEQSGLVGKTLRMVINGEANFVTTAEIIQTNLADIGVKVDIITYDQATFFGLLMDESNYEIGLYYVADTVKLAVDCFTNYPQFFDLGWSGPERDEFLALGARGMAIADASERSDIVYEQATVFSGHHLWYSLAESISLSAISKDIVGAQFYIDSNLLFKEWSWAS